jgi:hypothetical protein
MAAGLGFKTFTTGEVLTAGDVNGYLMQGINVFATTTARNAAITAPAEGQFAFTKDTNSLWYYDGAAWVASGATGDIEGVTAGVGISGGGTSGTVTVTNSMATAIDAKGDLVVGTGADAFSRIGVGANNTVLTADSAEATGVKWATPAAGGMTQLATGSLSGSSVSITSISGSYKNLYLLCTGVSVSTGAYVQITLNSDSGMQSNGFDGQAIMRSYYSYIRPIGAGARTLNPSNAESTFWVTIYNYAGTGSQRSFSTQAAYKDENIGDVATFFAGTWQNTANAVTSIQLELSTGSYDAGTYTLYGVS